MEQIMLNRPAVENETCISCKHPGFVAPLHSFQLFSPLLRGQGCNYLHNCERSEDVAGLVINVTGFNLSQHFWAEDKCCFSGQARLKNVDAATGQIMKSAVISWRWGHQERGQISGSWCFLSQLCYVAFGDLNIPSNDFDNEWENANLLILAHVQRRETCPAGGGQASYFAFLIWEHTDLAPGSTWTAVLMMLGVMLVSMAFHPVGRTWIQLDPFWIRKEDFYKHNGKALPDIPKY